MPGFGVLRANGYAPAPGPVLRSCGVASLGAALAGCHNLTLGALLANIVSGPEAHPSPERRYTAAVWAGGINILFGLFAGTFVGLMGILPAEALVAPIIILVTLSGITPLGIGAAFWGILAGLAVHAAERRNVGRRVPAAK